MMGFRLGWNANVVGLGYLCIVQEETMQFRQSDAEYLESSELAHYVKNLLLHLYPTPSSSGTTNDHITSCVSYFTKVQKCHHVVGADYVFVSSTRHNRRSFIYLVMESCKTIPPNEELSSADYQQLLQMLCADLPSELINCAVLSIDPIDGYSNPVRYHHHQLSVAVFFHIIYEKWLKLMEEYFIKEGSYDHLQLIKLRIYIDELATGNNFIEIPPTHAVEAVANNISKVQQEVTYANFRKELFKHPSIVYEVCKIPEHAEPFYDVTKEEDVVGSNNNAVSEMTSSQPPTDGVSVSGTTSDYMSL